MNIKRGSGILMPVSALPSKYGIGSFGKEAFAFADFLFDAGQSYWQILPLCLTGSGNSPYMSCSSFAGNPLFIDLDLLAEDGLLTIDELHSAVTPVGPVGPTAPVGLLTTDEVRPIVSENRIDYDSLNISRMPLLMKAKERGFERDREKVSAFINENPWVSDYSLFMACKKYFHNLPWNEWPDEGLKCHDESAVCVYHELLKDDIDYFTYVQFLFFKQWFSLRDYVHKKGISLIGDLPMYVAHDSADVWAAQDDFLLDEKGFPTLVAGVPPDYFSKEGQLWGNPLYDWDKMKSDGFGWWIRRIDGVGKLYDIIRLDHFRAFDEYFAIPADASSAKTGEWKKGPGISFIKIITGWFPDLRFIAEDLGILGDSVRKLVRDSGFPGMKVLQFAFVPGENSDYLPHNCNENSVCYTGTHDNDTLAGWLMKADEKTVDYIVKYTGLCSGYNGLNDCNGCDIRSDYSDCNDRSGCDDRAKDFNDDNSYLILDKKEDKSDSCGYFKTKCLADAVIRAGMAASSCLFIAQIQDYLYLDSYFRINTPGTVSNDNWSFRLPDGLLTKELSSHIFELTKLYGRIIYTN